MQSTAKSRPIGLKGLKKQRRIQIVVVAFVALALTAGLVGYAMKDGINFFRSPTQAIEEHPPASEVFRLGGHVKEGSVVERRGVQFDFVVTDGVTEVQVRYIGKSPRPDLFKEGTGTIATGSMIEGRFEATELLAKHDENYTPREVVEAMKEQGIYQKPGS